jgi:hypothetical protein
MKVDEHAEKPTAASGSVSLDKMSYRPQIRSVVSYGLRLRLVFSMLTAFAAAYACSWGGVSEAYAQPAAQLADAGIHAAQLPTGPLHLAAPELADAVSGEDTPDDEELADLSKSLLGRAHALVACAPASLQLEPSHTPSTQLDRPPRA